MLLSLAKEFTDYRKIVFDILCAHIRTTTTDADYQLAYKGKPSNEIQTIIDLILIPKSRESYLFYQLIADLNYVYLCGVNLEGAVLEDSELKGANLSGSNLFRANISSANLNEINFSNACLERAYFRVSEMEGADFIGSFLLATDFSGAWLENVNFSQTKLSGVIFNETVVTEGTFSEEQLKQIGDTSGIIFVPKT